MNKQSLTDLITSSGLSEVSKKELLGMVEAAETVNKEFLQKLRNKLAEIEDTLAEKIVNTQIQDAAEEFNASMNTIQKDVKELNADISKKTDEIDLQAARSKIA